MEEGEKWFAEQDSSVTTTAEYRDYLTSLRERSTVNDIRSRIRDVERRPVLIADLFKAIELARKTLANATNEPILTPTADAADTTTTTTTATATPTTASASSNVNTMAWSELKKEIDDVRLL